MIGVLTAAAFAGDCVPVPLDEVVADAADVTGLAVRGVAGEVRITGADGDEVRVSGRSCGGRVHVARSGGVLTVTVKGDEGAWLELSVPRALSALTVDATTGRVHVADVPARVAVVNATGDVAVKGAAHLRLAYVTGEVVVQDVPGDIVTDHVVGRITGPDAAAITDP